MKIIAFGHRSRMGKDTAAKMLFTNLKMGPVGYKFKKGIQRRAFAFNLKDTAYRLYKSHGVKPGEYYEDNPERRNDIIPKLNKTVVQLWIDIGMAMRGVYEHTWVDSVIYDDTCDVCIISDLRFPNEFEAVKSSGGICIKVHRDGVPFRDSPADNALESCTAWDELILNNGSLNDLNDTIIKIAEKYIYV